MSETLSTGPSRELPLQGRGERDALQEVAVSPEKAKLINEAAESILRHAGDAGIKRADFFKNPAFKGLTEEQISSVLAAAAAPVFEASGRVYWMGPSESKTSN